MSGLGTSSQRRPRRGREMSNRVVDDSPTVPVVRRSGRIRGRGTGRINLIGFPSHFLGLTAGNRRSPRQLAQWHKQMDNKRQRLPSESTTAMDEEGCDDDDTMEERPNQLEPVHHEDTDNDACGEEKFLKIFGNHLIADHIMSYLDHTSIKFISQTCQTLLGIVRESQYFLHHTKIVFSPSEREQQHRSTSLQRPNFPWKNVAVEMNKWQVITPSLLSQVESLEIYRKSYMNGVRVSHFVDYLNAAEKLQELTIGGRLLDILNNKVLTKRITSGTAKSNLEKVKSLRITGGIDWKEMYYVDRKRNFGLSLIAITEVPISLTSFTIQGIMLRPEQVAKAVIPVLHKHKTTLRSFSFIGYMYQEDEATGDGGIYGTVLPVLKELNFRTRGSELAKVASWLAKQPPLESLSLMFVESSVFDRRPLLTPLLFHGPTLKKFSLVWKREMLSTDNSDDEDPWESDGDDEDAPGPGPIPPPQPWDLLRNFGSLRELKILQHFIPNGRLDASSSPASILATIPDGIKTINLSGAASDHTPKVHFDGEGYQNRSSMGGVGNLT